jgi:hypothetical protein
MNVTRISQNTNTTRTKVFAIRATMYIKCKKKEAIMHVYIDEDGNNYNVTLTIRNGKLFASWDGQEVEINLKTTSITILE